jgi:hypothetical protein
MKLSLEQRSFIFYILGNFGSGMIFVIMLCPQLLNNVLASFLIVIVGTFELVVMGKLNFDAYRYGIVQGFLRNSRYKTQLSNTGNSTKGEKE